MLPDVVSHETVKNFICVTPCVSFLTEARLLFNIDTQPRFLDRAMTYCTVSMVTAPWSNPLQKQTDWYTMFALNKQRC